MIITGGENVYCAEAENALAAHPVVAEISAIGFLFSLLRLIFIRFRFCVRYS